jgi:hypothetical protein
MLDRDEHELKRLEDELRTGRPQPRPEFLDDLVTRLEQPVPAPSQSTRFRLGLAVAFATGLLVAGAALGAFGYAGSAARDAIEQSVDVVSDIVKPSGKREREVTVSAGSGGLATASVAFGGTTPSISTKSAHHQYPVIGVYCVRVHDDKVVTIVIPNVLYPLVQPWIVSVGPCVKGKSP